MKGGREGGVLSLILAVELAGSWLQLGIGCSRRQQLPRLSLEKQEKILLVLFASLLKVQERVALQERQGQNWWRKGRC